MAGVGTAAAGKVLNGTGNNSSPTFQDIGTNSGLTQFGVVIAEGSGAFQATAAGTNGQVLIGATGANPAFGTIGSSDGSLTFVTGANTLNITVTGGSTSGKTITGDSGGALSPTAGNWNILGLSGSKTSGSGSTLTVKSPPYTDQAGSTTVTLNSGSFATNAITLTTPATAGLADGDLVEFVATNGVLVVQMNTGQVGHLAGAATSSGGTFTGSATGDSLSLRWQASTSDWWATSALGVWVLA